MSCSRTQHGDGRSQGYFGTNISWAVGDNRSFIYKGDCLCWCSIFFILDLLLAGDNLHIDGTELYEMVTILYYVLRPRDF